MTSPAGGQRARSSTLKPVLHTTDFGTAVHDIAIYSHVAHQESPADNITTLTRLRRALKPGGMLVVSEFIVEAYRSCPPFPLIIFAR